MGLFSNIFKTAKDNMLGTFDEEKLKEDIKNHRIEKNSIAHVLRATSIYSGQAVKKGLENVIDRGEERRIKQLESEEKDE